VSFPGTVHVHRNHVQTISARSKEVAGNLFRANRKRPGSIDSLIPSPPVTRWKGDRSDFQQSKAARSRSAGSRPRRVDRFAKTLCKRISIRGQPRCWPGASDAVSLFRAQTRAIALQHAVELFLAGAKASLPPRPSACRSSGFIEFRTFRRFFDVRNRSRAANPTSRSASNWARWAGL